MIPQTLSCFMGFMGTAATVLSFIAAFPTANADDVAFRESHAGLLAAQKAVFDGKLSEAKTIYSALLQRDDIPKHHQWEAEERLKEIERMKKGLPPRDPAANRAAMPRRPNPAVIFYVAPDGDDNAPGTRKTPFHTLERARDAIRTLKQSNGLPAGGVEVCIRGGEYRVSRTFVLTEDDAGDEISPIVYRAEKEETPRFRGGISVKRFQPVRDAVVLDRLPDESRDNVLCADLKPLGIKNIKPLIMGGFGSGRGFRTYPVSELFFDGRAMPLARWPNQGFAKIDDVVLYDAKPKRGRIGSDTGLLKYKGDRPNRWLQEADAWLHGYWFWGWCDSHERIASIDPLTQEIALVPPYHRYGYRKGQPFHAENILAELDMSGEWYLDRKNAMLYFWPPSDPNKAAIELSLNDFPFIAMDDVSHVAFEGIVWELGAGDALRVSGGDHCLIAGCTVRCCGGTGIIIDGGSDHGVLSCDIHTLGRGGVFANGGDRKTLMPGRHFVENCDIHGLARIDRTYTQAVRMEGVGNRIAHNRLHDLPSSAIRLEGNDHLVEYNDVFQVVQESDDQGGLDIFNDCTFRGNIIRYNAWRSIGDQRPSDDKPEHGWAGVRLDDAISGVLIYSNVFFRASAGKRGFGAVQINGGKDNILDNNIFIECASAVTFSYWNASRWNEHAKKALESAEIDRNLYRKKYAELNKLGENINRNILVGNLAVRCGKFIRNDNECLEKIDNLTTTEYSGLFDSHKSVFQIVKSATALTRFGMRPIPVEEIGLYVDSFRKVLPRPENPSGCAPR